MKHPTMTFGDMAMCFTDDIPPRKCEIEPFLCLSVERYPTPAEKKKSPNTWLIIEKEVFLYRPFKIIKDLFL